MKTNKFDRLLAKFQSGLELTTKEYIYLQEHLQKIEDATIGCGLSFRSAFIFASQTNDRISDILIARNVELNKINKNKQNK